ncbi:MAG: glycosyltransferase family 4 protein [Thermoflexales bacterium]|nr:glycosyltransferase family 4 protein [Thermoflexales bacterium]
MRIGIDITAAVRQGAGIGRFTREIVRALLALDDTRLRSHHFVLLAATAGLPRASWQPRLDYITQPAGAGDVRFATPALAKRSAGASVCNLSFVSDDWLHRLWHRARLPVPVELALGRLDLFHEPDFVLPPTLRGTLTLLTVHDLTFKRDPDSAYPKLRRYLDRVVPASVQRASHVLADSTATKDDLVELFGTPPDKISVILGGVEKRFAPVTDPERLAAVRRKYALGDGPFILGLGTIQPRKNYRRLIQAFLIVNCQLLTVNGQLASPVAKPGGTQYGEQSIQNSKPTQGVENLKLVIAGGKGWLYEDIFAEVKRLGLEGSVVFPGFVDDDDLPALYSAASVLAYPSLYEGFGLPVLEAMACGTPVVTSNVSSLPEVAGVAALTVTPTDVDALGGALLAVLTDEALRRQMIERGLVHACRFTWEDSARQLLAAYERVAAQAKSPIANRQ